MKIYPFLYDWIVYEQQAEKAGSAAEAVTTPFFTKVEKKISWNVCQFGCILLRPIKLEFSLKDRVWQTLSAPLSQLIIKANVDATAAFLLDCAKHAVLLFLQKRNPKMVLSWMQRSYHLRPHRHARQRKRPVPDFGVNYFQLFVLFDDT